jgi:hypothetical protein
MRTDLAFHKGLLERLKITGWRLRNLGDKPEELGFMGSGVGPGG